MSVRPQPTTPVTIPALGPSGPPVKTLAQRLIHRTFLCGVLVGPLQVVLAALALWIGLALLGEGTLVTRGAILLPVGSLVCYSLALASVARLRKHQRFHSWLPAICYLVGLTACGAMVLFHLTDPSGLKDFFVQPKAKLPPGEMGGEPRSIFLAAATLSVAGAMGIFPLFYILRIRMNSDARRLLRWMATQ